MRAMPASDFIDWLAVNTHVNYTDGAYVNVHNIADDLNWLGIRHVRDIVPNGSPPFDNYVYLARRGVKFNFLVRTNIDESIAQAVA
ncbi:calcium-binding protein, partial [Paraburkholderia sp. SIMBA_050]